MTDKRYRICADCGQTWNVSSLTPNEKKYICPHCEYKKSRPNAVALKAAR